jgi:hypothetical protein
MLFLISLFAWAPSMMVLPSTSPPGDRVACGAWEGQDADGAGRFTSRVRVRARVEGGEGGDNGGEGWATLKELPYAL